MSFLSALLPKSANDASACACADDQSTAATIATREPAYKVKESPEAFELTVYLPGVSRESLEVTDEDNVLTVRGERRWKAPSDWQSVYRETSDEVFALSLRHDESIQTDKVQARLADGVLKVTLPKVEAAKPRKISVA